MYKISEQCKKCGLCAKKCVNQAIVGVVKEHFAIIESKCKNCGLCYHLCPSGAIARNGELKPKEGKKKKTVIVARIREKECMGCKNCHFNCPHGFIEHKKARFSAGVCAIDPQKCLGCGYCTKMCLNNCIEMVPFAKE